MGHNVMVLETSGKHDNGAPDDADVLLKEFAARLADAGHEVHRVSFTTGSTRELLNADDTTPLDAGTAEAPVRHAYRHRPH